MHKFINLLNHFAQGQHCEKCKPLYVGSAVGGGVCRPCREFCRGNSDVCLSKDELKLALDYPKEHPLDPEGVSMLSYLFIYLLLFYSSPLLLAVAVTLLHDTFRLFTG